MKDLTMRRFIPTLTLATTLALTTLGVAEPLPCADLLGPMTGIMQTMRRSATLSAAEQRTWQQWNAHCNTPTWQQVLKIALPTTIPPAPERLTHSNKAPSTGVRSDTRYYAPITTCRTYSSRWRAETTCMTY